MSAPLPGTQHAFDARRRPPMGGFNRTFLLIEVRRLLRNRRTVVLTLVVPAILFLLLKSDRRGIQLAGTVISPATTMIGIAVYGAMLAATSGGAMVSIERALGWSRQLRLTPLTPIAYIAIKVLMAMLLGLTSVLVVYTIGAFSGIEMAPIVWVLTAVLAWAASFVFASFGLFMGYLLPSENVMQAIGPTLGIFSLFGGLFIPVNLLPAVMQNIAPFVPTYGVAAIARYPLLGGAFDPVWLISVLFWTAIFGLAAMALFRRDTGRTSAAAAQPRRSASTDEGHPGGHHGHELDVCVKGQAGHVNDRPSDVLEVDRRLGGDPAVGLQGAPNHLPGHLGPGVADVDLAAGDVVRPAVERGRLGQAGDRVLARDVGSRQRSRRVGRDRAVVDDPPALRPLVFHQPERAPGHQERAGHIRHEDRQPGFEGQVLDRGRRCVLAGVVEQQVEPPEVLADGVVHGGHRRLVGRVRGDRQGIHPCLSAGRSRFLERFRPAPDHDEGEACRGQRDRCRAADPRPGTGDQCNPARSHVQSPPGRVVG